MFRKPVFEMRGRVNVILGYTQNILHKHIFSNQITYTIKTITGGKLQYCTKVLGTLDLLSTCKEML